MDGWMDGCMYVCLYVCIILYLPFFWKERSVPSLACLANHVSNMQMLQSQHWPQFGEQQSQYQAEFQDYRASGFLCSPRGSSSWFCPMMRLMLTPSFSLGSDWSRRKKSRCSRCEQAANRWIPKPSPTSTPLGLSQGKNTLGWKTWKTFMQRPSMDHQELTTEWFPFSPEKNQSIKMGEIAWGIMKGPLINLGIWMRWLTHLSTARHSIAWCTSEPKTSTKCVPTCTNSSGGC